MGGAVASVMAKGEPPATLYHPREMPFPLTATAKLRQWGHRHHWRNWQLGRMMGWMTFVNLPIAIYFLSGNPTTGTMGSWNKRTHDWAELREEKMYHLQKNQDTAYYVWRDGADAAKLSHTAFVLGYNPEVHYVERPGQ